MRDSLVKFKGYVYTVIPIEDVAHVMKYGVRFPDDYEVMGINLQSNIEGFKHCMVIAAEAPDVKDNTREYVEAVRCDNGYKVRRWQPEN